MSDGNRNRVLINLHGGGMIVGGRYGGQLESIPVSSIGRIKVVTVDYRMAPEHRYPAAEDDAIAVYRELLKTYRPENIGVYGCSSGAWLTGTTVAKLIAAGQLTPRSVCSAGVRSAATASATAIIIFRAASRSFRLERSRKANTPQR